jgi:ubiquinol-cytochrome c reductase cytochrome b subunit
LHSHGSNNPTGINSKIDTLPLYPFFALKDNLGFMPLLLLYLIFGIISPNTFIHPDNYIAATPLVTPSHIVPE